MRGRRAWSPARWSRPGIQADDGEAATGDARLCEAVERGRIPVSRLPSGSWELMPMLGFDYDSSYSDTDPYEPQPGGCCTYLPYFNQEMVELPITMAQDHTLFAILQNPEASTWLQKAHLLRERRGMVLVLTHPDYAHDRRIVDGYRRLLDEFAGDDTVWHALPRDVATWWRNRAVSRICDGEGGWRIVGPAAAEGRVRFATPVLSEEGTL